MPVIAGDRPSTALDKTGLKRIREAFVASAKRAARLGLDGIQVHAAHGYLLHNFLSPLSNQRTDEYGGSFTNRMRFPLEVYAAVREAFPAEKPVSLRVSATDWMPGGWDLESTIAFAEAAKALGCCAVNVSSGGTDPKQAIPLAPGYQVPMAREIRRATGLPVVGVGLITDFDHAESIVATGDADMIGIARRFCSIRAGPGMRQRISARKSAWRINICVRSRSAIAISSCAKHGVSTKSDVSLHPKAEKPCYAESGRPFRMTDLARYGSLEAAILACAKGDRVALRAIYEAESARLLGIAFRMLKRRAAAEDVLQDTFLTLWEQAHRFDGRPGYGRAWLSTLLRNRTLNVLRGEARLELVEDFEPLGLEMPGESAEDAMTRLSEESALKRCLEGLEEARRKIILLAFTEGLSHGEIAARLGTPLGTVKSWVRRSLLTLKECMG